MSSNYSKEELDNHSNQLNPNNDEYYNSRGLEKPDFYDDDEYETDEYDALNDFENWDYEPCGSDDFD